MRHFLIVGHTADERRRASQAHIPATHAVISVDAPALPFTRAAQWPLPPAPRVVLVHDFERAFPDAQAGSTRLVLTQSTYLLQTWIDTLDSDDRIIATADRAALERHAPEAFQGRGPWRAFRITEARGDSGLGIGESARVRASNPESQIPHPVDGTAAVLARAFSASSSDDRLQLCRDAASSDPRSAAAWLALASARRESRDGDGAREALDRAAALAPDWEAVHYESGKLWLVYDDLPRAREAFQRAADLMPTFSAALSNLGATCGELGDPDAALAAFTQALEHDPRSHMLLNNVGVVSRELGRLDDSESAFRRVIAIAPEFVFGHYNLGHTLFLSGRYSDAVRAYEEGQRRDPDKNRRQACRLAMARFAAGDVAGAEHDLWRFANQAPAGEREDLLLEAYEIGHALVTGHPALGANLAARALLDRLGAEITKSE